MRREGRGGTIAIPLVPWQIQAIVKATQIPESRRGSSMWTSVYSGGFPSPRAAPLTAYRLPSPLFPKTLTTVHLVIKNQKLRRAYCSPRTHQLRQCGRCRRWSLPATRLTQKTLTTFCGNCVRDATSKTPKTWWK